MSWLSNLLGIKPDRRKEVTTGLFWREPGTPALAAGRGWTQEVVGESFYKTALEKITKGATVQGVMMSQAMKLIAESYDGEPSVSVLIDGHQVGSIPKADAAMIHAELLKISPTGMATAKGQISAGYEGADYCVRLSLARPLKVR